MASWDKITDWLMKWEGGYQNQTTDDGNYDNLGRLIGTNHGIAAITLDQYMRVTQNIKLTDLSKADAIAKMKALTEADAKKIGKKLFWDTIRGDEIKDQSVANVILQWYWGRPSVGVRYSKAAISNLVKGLTDDNKMRSSEVQLINDYKDQKKIFEAIKQEQYEWYDNMNNSTYETGWLSRLSSMIYSGGSSGGGSKSEIRIAIPVILISLSIAGLIIYFNTRRKTT